HIIARFGKIGFLFIECIPGRFTLLLLANLCLLLRRKLVVGRPAFILDAFTQYLDSCFTVLKKLLFSFFDLGLLWLRGLLLRLSRFHSRCRCLLSDLRQRQLLGRGHSFLYASEFLASNFSRLRRRVRHRVRNFHHWRFLVYWLSASGQNIQRFTALDNF